MLFFDGGISGPEEYDEYQHHFRNFFRPLDGVVQNVTAEYIRRGHKHQKGKDDAPDMMNPESYRIQIDHFFCLRCVHAFRFQLTGIEVRTLGIDLRRIFFDHFQYVVIDLPRRKPLCFQ